MGKLDNIKRNIRDIDIYLERNMRPCKRCGCKRRNKCGFKSTVKEILNRVCRW